MHRAWGRAGRLHVVSHRNATSPYLENDDYIWVIFLPVAFINSSLVDRGESTHAR